MPTRRRRRSPHQLLIDEARPYYEHMLEAQGGVCALCGRAPSEKRRLDIDHDHKDMYIRGLLCHRCNRWLAFWITVEWLLAAAKYIQRGPKWFDNIKKKADKE